MTSAYGLHSPLARFFVLVGMVLLLTNDHDAANFLHHEEHVAKIPGKQVGRFCAPFWVQRRCISVGKSDVVVGKSVNLHIVCTRKSFKTRPGRVVAFS